MLVLGVALDWGQAATSGFVVGCPAVWVSSSFAQVVREDFVRDLSKNGCESVESANASGGGMAPIEVVEGAGS